MSLCNTAGPQHSGTKSEKRLFSRMQAAQDPTPNYNSRRAPGLPRSAPPLARQQLRAGRAHERSPLRHLTGCRDWAGLSGARGTVPPSDRSPGLLFGPLTSNEERAGRKGRGCGGAGTARRARGRGR